MPRGRSKKVSDDQIVDQLKEWPKEGKLPSTSNLKDEINEEYGEDYDRKTIYRRLDSLESDGRISNIEVGLGRGGSVGWYDPDHYIPGEPEPESPGPATVEPQTDGLGGWLGRIPAEAIAPLSKKVGKFFVVSGLLLIVASYFTGGLVLGLGVALLVLAACAYYAAYLRSDVADPTFTFEEAKEHLEGERPEKHKEQPEEELLE